MAFELPDFQTVKLTNVNPRIEKHGTESVPAADLNFTLTAANSILEQFDVDLLLALYGEPDADEPADQEELEGVDPVSLFTVLRFPKINPIKWDSKHAGYALSIDYGLGGESCLEIEGCEVGKFVLDCMEGGTVEIKFQVQCSSGLTEKIMGKLSLMIGQEVSIMLTAPEAAPVQEVMQNPLPGDTTPDKPLTATDIFVAGAAPGAVH
jgi:hypothetical protein